jgi:Polyketide cyclase / dehydrase and lipid transport
VTPDTPPTAVARADFDVPAETVWAYRLDFANLPEYNPDVRDVTRVRDGDQAAEGDTETGRSAWGPGARYRFSLADARQPGASQPVELWTVSAAKPTLVAAGMEGGSAAYEEFVVEPRRDGGCTATLTLWVTLPEGLPDDMVAMAATGSQAQIDKEMRLMKENLERSTGSSGLPPA